MAVVLLDALIMLIDLVGAGTSDSLGLVVVSIGLHGWLVWALWKGWRRARWLTLGAGALLTITSLLGGGTPYLLRALVGVALVALIVPKASRSWFDR
ncbi:hypothetical protein BDK92_0302 [Micromonospora pisi]|uniref:Uncharacterized protein n=2 Tax=Micromonospora pisi TaxID=589240 RepID=A0A495JBG6_9ACTN|nr:hypothetical protein BDK92_0302 [Micromonospora pisi]